MKKSLEHSALPTVEEIKLYQEGKLSPSRTHEIELLAEENPMLGDALEGYAALPLFAAVPGVTAAVGQQAAASSANGVIGGTKGIASIAKSASSLWQLNSWVIGFGIVGVSAAVITTIVLQDESETNAAMTNEVNKPAQANEEKATLIEGNEQTASYATESHELKTKEVSNSQIGVDNQLPISYTNSISVSETHPSSNIDHESTIESPLPFDIDPIMTVESNPSVVSDEAGLKLSNSSVVAVGITTIMKYKVADYTQLRKATWDKINIEDLSLSANYAAKANKEAEEQSNKIQIPYLQYIEQCITVYDNQEYRTAINGFLALLKQYPDDINAQFYGAMSYYHHDQPVLALELLEKAEKNPISTFREEIQFYKAKCLKMLNRTEESTSIFQSIINRNGFYRGQAQKELND